MDILLELSSSQAELLNELDQASFETVSVSNFGGGADVLQLVVTLSGFTIPAITKIVVESIRARKHLRIVVDGVEVQGVSEATAATILNELIVNREAEGS